MINKKLIILFFIVTLNFSFAGQFQDRFVEANKMYQDGQFEQSIETYESIIASGYESGDLYFNLGNAYYKAGDIAKSRINYERALLWLDGDEDLLQNIELLKLHLVDQIEPTPKLFLNVWWEEILKIANIETFGYINLFLSWIVLFSAALFLHFRKRGLHKMKTLFVTSLILLFLAGSVWITKIYQFETENYGIILNSTVTVFSGPADNSTELFVIHEATKVKIERIASDWYEIRLEDGKTGWLSQNVLEII